MRHQIPRVLEASLFLIGPSLPCPLRLKGKILPCTRLSSVIDGNLNLSISCFRRTRASVIRETINDTEIQFTGSWSFVDDPALLPPSVPSCHITNRSGDQAQYTFQGRFPYFMPVIPQSARPAKSWMILETKKF